VIIGQFKVIVNEAGRPEVVADQGLGLPPATRPERCSEGRRGIATLCLAPQVDLCQRHFLRRL